MELVVVLLVAIAVELVWAVGCLQRYGRASSYALESIKNSIDNIWEEVKYNHLPPYRGLSSKEKELLREAEDEILLEEIKAKRQQAEQEKAKMERMK